MNIGPRLISEEGPFLVGVIRVGLYPGGLTNGMDLLLELK